MKNFITFIRELDIGTWLLLLVAIPLGIFEVWLTWGTIKNVALLVWTLLTGHE